MSFLSKEEMQKVAEGLEPCPLCRSDKLYVLRVSNGVVCTRCGIRMIGNGWMKRWNMRR